MKIQKSKARENGAYRAVSPTVESNAWGSVPPTPQTPSTTVESEIQSPTLTSPSDLDGGLDGQLHDKGKSKEGSPVRKFRGVPEDVQLFEVFWRQVVELIKVD